MNTKNLWTAALIGALLTTLVSNLPFIDLINILCFTGFWGSALIAVWLYRRLNKTLSIKEGLFLGALTGICAGFLGFTLSFFDLAGFQRIANELSQILPGEQLQDIENIPLLGILVFNLFGVLLNVIFGTCGGWIGGAIFRTKRV